MAIPGVVIGLLTGVVPFIFTRLNTGNGAGGEGWLKTHTTRDLPPAGGRVAPSQLPSTPVQNRVPLPPNDFQPIDPWANEPAPTIAPAPAPEPPAAPPPVPAAIVTQDPSRLPAIRPSAPEPAPLPPPAPEPQAWDAPTQTRLPSAQDIAQIPEPAPMPTPPPFIEPVAEAPSAPLASLPIATAPTPAPTPTADTPPDGYDPVKAKNLAKQVANNITNRGNSYAHDLLKQFQRAAGIAVDGTYGGESRGALEFFGVRRPPPALFKPTATQPYKWATWSAS